ncbi:SRR1-like protein isoform X1 [Antechinus flavipes]|uniref:SRR1-like protein isoform X1 n=1 Tax=Antechinus flavipes TaxID=38775 RepID=UPI002235637B|nr:SRR1-like protein isoform X1 [Antechinus flavipes]
MAAPAVGGWRTVPKRRGRRPRPGRAAADAEAPEGSRDGSAVRRRVCEARDDLQISDFWHLTEGIIQKCFTEPLEQLQVATEPISEVLEHLHLEPSQPVEASNSNLRGDSLKRARCFKCVCYGIGKFASCVIARNQLAFLLLLLEKLQIPRNHCYIFDPLFNELEISVLNTLGLTVLKENEEGKRNICGEPTIFYMIHCGTALYNNLLWSNWSVDSLSKMMIIGNSFRRIEGKLLTRILQKKYPYVANILKGTEEIEFPQTLQYMDVFNDTAIHRFPLRKLKELPDEIWAFQEEPDYSESEELEIIRNQRKLIQPLLG